MDSRADVAKKLLRFKLQLTDTAESATETGIGKTVNSLRRHVEAGKLAKSLVMGWKRLVPKESRSLTGDGNASESLSFKDQLEDQNCPNNGSLTMGDSNNNCLKSHLKSQNSSDDATIKTSSMKADSGKPRKELKRHRDKAQGLDENREKCQQENQHVSQNDILKQNIDIQENQINISVVSKKRKERDGKSRNADILHGKKNSEDPRQQSSSDFGRFGSEKKLNEKQKKQSSTEDKGSFSIKSSHKHLKTLKLASVKEDRSSPIKRKKRTKEKHCTLKDRQESEEKGPSKDKKAKLEHKKEQTKSNEPSSFESYLNYDVNVFKKKTSGGKKLPKTLKTVVKERERKRPDMKPLISPGMSMHLTSPTQEFKESVLEAFRIPSPTGLPGCEKPYGVEYFEMKVERESESCELSEESVGFTGQRLNKKMQVYSGAKTAFLPTMMSLHQQCIRTLQNNINLLYETGGVPFEILEPVLERCTPEQLLRIEECNPIYMGETDHLWGKHCQRDFKHSKLQEYESWKEMYVRLSEERERKLKRLTKSIVSANSTRPKGRQVKMAFIHSVAKPPRDVRIQQEIHGTASLQPQLKSSLKVQDNRPRPSNEPSRSGSTSSGAPNTQDPRKKTRVAPMMAKSLKAFKKQLGRR
ncbi:elongin A, like isoform 2-T2 [Spinachia spinachia]